MQLGMARLPRILITQVTKNILSWWNIGFQGNNGVKKQGNKVLSEGKM